MFPFRIRWPEHANEEIPLGEAEANLGINGKTLARTFNVLLQLLPVPHVEFRGQFPRPDLNIGDIQNAGDCELLLENDPTPVRITRLSFSRTDIDLTLSPRHERAYIGIKEPAEQIRAVLFNFPDVWTRVAGSMEDEEAGSFGGTSTASMHDDVWRVELFPLISGTGQLLEELQHEGGYAVTHGISISRVDGALITFEASIKIIEALGFFFTFVRGIPCVPTLVHGVTGEEARWVNLGAPQTERWSMTYN